MKLIVDMDPSPLRVGVFERAGFEASHWTHEGWAASKDSEILAWARAQESVVFASDFDFGRMLAVSGVRLPSVVQLRVGRHKPDELGPMVLSAIRISNAEFVAGALLAIERAQWRVRLLPIRPTQFQ